MPNARPMRSRWQIGRLMTIRNRLRRWLPVPRDVARLVVAARVVAFEDRGDKAIKELDAASEAFADRVRWEGEPDRSNP